MQKKSTAVYYIHPDHLGSIHVTTNENGSVVQELSFDACSVKLAFCAPPTGGETKSIAAQIPKCEAKREGRQRNATDWSYSSLPAPKFDRGYTFHEHLPEFGLINMNGRMGVYPDKRSDIGNPMLGRFLSPDPVLQSPGNLQNYNRYSYVLNNRKHSACHVY